jgi:putative tryptophan/tyrosine transport system substrate-binding protein
MRRRDAILGIGCTAVAWSLRARAAQEMPVVGFLSGSTVSEPANEAFRQGLGLSGFHDGTNVSIELRYADNNYERLDQLAADLVHRRAAVIVAGGGAPSAEAAKRATQSIPIVFVNGVDPVASGLVTSINHPSGNVTGISFFGVVLISKRMELLHQLVPKAKILALLTNLKNPNLKLRVSEASAAAEKLGHELFVASASTADEIEPAFVSLHEHSAGGLLVDSDPLFGTQRAQVIALAARYEVPTVYDFREYVTAGGLMCYGTSMRDAYRQAGIYAARILKGEKPNDLPVMQPTKIETVINLRTAKALSVEIPSSIAALADEVIE